MSNTALPRSSAPPMHAGAAPDAPDYRNTAVRRTWPELPEPLKDRISVHLGGPVTRVQPAGGGFTPGFAAVLGTGTASTGSRRLFVKAAPESDGFIYPSYLREALVVPLLPTGLPMPKLHAAEQLIADGTSWQLLIYEAVDGVMPGHPWMDADLLAVEASCADAARSLRDFPPELAGDPLADDLAEVPSQFLAVAEGGPAPWFVPGLSAREAAGFQHLLESCPEALAGTAVLHGDLRPDNILMRSGRALICDWNFLGTGAAWTDWVAVLPYARAGGLDADAELRRSALTRDVPDRYIDAFLAGMLNYMLHAGSQPDVPTSPQLRVHGRHTARIVYDWCVHRNAV